MHPKIPRLILCAGLLLMSVATLPAQPAAPAPAGGGQGNAASRIVSPEIGADRRVTFRLAAPSATKVTILGHWDNQVHELTKDAQGVWSITLGPIEPSYWIYNFTVDGVDIADPVNPEVKLRMRTSASLLSVPAPAGAPWDPRMDVPHGSVEINWHSSKITGDTRSYHVYTPPGYDPSGAARYPVLYLLHGNNGTAADWTSAGRAHFMADNLIADRKMVPMIIVMTLGHAVPFNGAQAENSATFERYLLEDVLPAVDRKYRVAAGPANRAILGLSMGGGQAIRIGLGHLDRFAAVGGFSSSNIPDFATRFQALLADPAGTNAKLKVLWIGCGRQDRAFGGAEALAKTLADAKINRTFFAIDGFHDYFFWRRCFLETAPLLFRAEAKASAASG